MPTSPFPSAFDKTIINNGRASEASCSKRLISMFGFSGSFFYYSAARMGLYEVLSCMKEMKPARQYVVTCAFTCSVVINAIRRAGLIPLYIDINRVSLGPSVEDIFKVVSEVDGDILGIIAQHSFGIPSDLSLIAEICMERGIFLIEDCATTFGASLNGRICGSWGDAAIFSFDTSKPVSVGAGGLLLVHSDSLSERIMDRYVAMAKQPKSHYIYLRFYRFFFSIRYFLSLQSNRDCF